MDEKIRHEQTGVDGPKHNVWGRSWTRPDAGKRHGRFAFEPHRLLPGQLPSLDRYWVEAAVYMNDCLSDTATTANAHFKSPCEAFIVTLSPPSTLAFMQPGFHRTHRTHRTPKSDPKAERGFYLNRGRNHPRDLRQGGHGMRLYESSSRDVTREVEGRPITEAAPQARMDAVPAPWEADLRVRYLPPELATVTPGMTAGEDAGATGGAAAAAWGNATVIPTGGREPSGRGRRGPLGQRTPSTGADAREDEGVPPGVHYGAVSRPRTFSTSARPTRPPLLCQRGTRGNPRSPRRTRRRCVRHVMQTGRVQWRGRLQDSRKLGISGMLISKREGTW